MNGQVLTDQASHRDAAKMHPAYAEFIEQGNDVRS
jgi:hypothetical protein